MKKCIAIVCLILSLLIATSFAQALGQVPSGYFPVQVVMLSRHNIRAPLTKGNAFLETATAQTWVDFSVNAGELTNLGGTQETTMGQYFRDTLQAQGLIPENWEPEAGQVRFYANSLQRTIATARFFASGFLPVYDTEIEHHCPVGQMDPVFNPVLTYVSDAYIGNVRAEIGEGASADRVMAALKDDLAVLEDVLGFSDSAFAKENGIQHIAEIPTETVYKQGSEPGIIGGLKYASTAADTLIMQYYEKQEDEAAGLGRVLTWEEWRSIGRIPTAYQSARFGTPLLAVNVAHPLLMELRSELTTEGRVFSFLCGHDSNVESVLVALGAEMEPVTDNLSGKTPIGCKIVWEKWKGPDGKYYISMELCYRDSESLRANRLCSPEAPASSAAIALTGLEKNEAGLYCLEDVLARFDEAIDAYDRLDDEPEKEVFDDAA